MFECELIREPIIDGRHYHIKYLLAYERTSFREWLCVMNDLDYELIWLGKSWVSFGYTYDHTDICIIYMAHGHIKLSWYDGLVSLPIYINAENDHKAVRDGGFYGFPIP